MVLSPPLLTVCLVKFVLNQSLAIGVLMFLTLDAQKLS